MVWLKINAPGKSEFHYIGKFENLLISELESELQQFLACLTSSVTTPILFIAYEMGPEAAGIPVIEWNYPSDSDILGGMMGSARVRKILFFVAWSQTDKMGVCSFNWMHCQVSPLYLGPEVELGILSPGTFPPLFLGPLVPKNTQFNAKGNKCQLGQCFHPATNCLLHLHVDSLGLSIFTSVITVEKDAAFLLSPAIYWLRELGKTS